MTKSQIIDRIVKKIGINRESAEQVINLFLSEIEENVIAGVRVKIVGFGSFIRSRRKVRVGSDPNTHHRTTFRAKGWPKFVPSQHLKKVVE